MSTLPEATYDNAFSPYNVYGHALALLQRHRTEGPPDRVHLDVGCGYARIAEPLAAALGVTYIGVDADSHGRRSLHERGFETHEVWLGEEEATYLALRAVVGDRRLASITMLDTLEHLPDGDATVRALRRLAAEHYAFVVLSVPNVAHMDVGLKLALGRWDYTEAGLLDHTHVRFFTADMLERVLRHVGLHPLGANDVMMEISDQSFPAGHPVLARGTQLHQYLAGLRHGADGHARVNQFVRICLAGPQVAGPTWLEREESPRRPFLTVLMRTQGRRPHTLREALTSLAAQSDCDFELFIAGHRLTVERQIVVEQVIEDSPAWLRARTRLIRVDDGGRTRPLNVGFAEAAGDYIAILDDDDLPMGHWVETFRTLALSAPGRLLRTVAIRQKVRTAKVAGKEGLRAEGPLERIFSPRFDYFEHLRMNHTPCLAVAFPRGAFHDLGMQFDETLTTTEDWYYIMRVAPVVGAASSEEITCIYRWWMQEESSRTMHSEEEWRENQLRIYKKMDGTPQIWPAGSTARLRQLLDSYDHLNGMSYQLNAVGPHLQGELRARLREVQAILWSTSWQLSAPLRGMARLMGRPRADYSGIFDLQPKQLATLVAELKGSRSWRLTALLRRWAGCS